MFLYLDQGSSSTNEAESTQSCRKNGHAHSSHSSKRRHRNTTSVRVPSVNVISEVGDNQMVRSQSVGHNMASTNSSTDSNNLLNINYNNDGRKSNKAGVSNRNGKTDGMRYTLSQPLLINSSSDSEHESKPLKDSHKHWRSGTLSRADIFYQVSLVINEKEINFEYKFILFYFIFEKGSLCNIPNYKSHSELPADLDRYGSLRRINDTEVLNNIYYKNFVNF